MKSRFKKFVIATGALALLVFTGPTAQNHPLGAINAYASELTQTDRWHVDSNGTWYLHNQDRTGNVLNSWFQDLDGAWYLLAPGDGHMYAGLIHDTLTDRWYFCQTEHDGWYGKMAEKDGVYTVNGQQIHLTFNQAHDGTFGAITSGLESLKGTGLITQDVQGLPTESTNAGSPTESTNAGTIPHSPAPTMYVGGTDGALVEVTPGMDPSEIDDPVARSNYELSLGIVNETLESDETISYESDETMSYNDWENLNDAIREHNQKEVEKWFEVAGW